MTTERLPLTGQVIGETQRAIEPLLGTILARVGTDFPTWVTLNTLATRGGALPCETLEGDLAAGLDTAASDIRDLLERLAAAGLLGASGDDVELAPVGRALHQRVRDGIARVNADLYAGMDLDDLVTARRVLVEVAERARALRGR